MTKMKQGSKAFNEEALALALSFSEIYACIDCGHPVRAGFCCGHCDSANGYNQYDEPAVISYTAKRTL